ncbi:hypothetical protein [Psychrobacter alimentarius]|uniref:hypothetical protein n=1 Tax=Psychrobacter alimentarius TaxID=261164 RepID=UPI00103E1F0B
MENEMDVERLISKSVLDGLTHRLLYIYELTEDANSTQYDTNYSFGTNLYGKSLPAIKEYAEQHESFEDLSGSGRAILKLIDSPLYFRFIRNSPLEYRRKINNKDILDLFNLSDTYPRNLDLFSDKSFDEDPLLGFFFFASNSELEDSVYIRLQIFDKFWKLRGEWSSDSVQEVKLLTVETFDEIAKELPEAKPQVNGDKQLTPVARFNSDVKKDA